MKILKYILCGCLFILCCTQCKDNAAKEEKKAIPVIFDTDVGNDIDDVLALQMLFNYENQGLIDLLGISISKSNQYSIEYIDAYSRLNNRHDIPLGFAYDGVNPENGGYTKQTLDTIIDGDKILHPKRSLNSNLPEGYKLMRKLLVSQEDSSVVLLAVGPETNLARLLDSEGDEYSELGGKDLILKKVKLLTLMGGLFSEEYDFTEWNLEQDLQAAKKVFSEWPTEIVTSGWELGYKLQYPHQSILNDFENGYKHPLCVSYQVYEKMPYDRPTWDLISTLYAAEPDNSYFRLSPRGTIVLDEVGKTKLIENPDGKHRYMLVDDDKIQEALDAIVGRVVSKGN